MSLPILYSLRQCPYAMRARIGLLLAEQPVMLRNIIMTNIPQEMFVASAKGEVPVLVFDDSSVIDESLDIMVWALKQNDPSNLLYIEQSNALDEMLSIIKHCDTNFVDSLKKYKAASRYHDDSKLEKQQQCEVFIEYLEAQLNKHDYIFGKTPSLVDYAILPFVRQLSRVDKKWYQQSPYPKLRKWLERHYQNPIFSKAMKQHPLWLDTKKEVVFQ